MKNKSQWHKNSWKKIPVCLPNHYGPSCAKCTKKCQTCDSITGRCTQCPASFYGEKCQYSCPQHCLDLNCDKTTGSCNGCKDGYHGQQCQLELTTAVITTGYNYEKKTLVIKGHRSKCHAQMQNREEMGRVQLEKYLLLYKTLLMLQIFLEKYIHLYRFSSPV